jgi:hypothetical protein
VNEALIAFLAIMWNKHRFFRTMERKWDHH